MVNESIRAKKEGISSQQVIDKYHKMMGDAFKDFGISFDIYARTSSPTHHKTASEFFTNLYEKNIFSEKYSNLKNLESIDKLTIEYNRSRQAEITNEIIEISDYIKSDKRTL